MSQAFAKVFSEIKGIKADIEEVDHRINKEKKSNLRTLK